MNNIYKILFLIFLNFNAFSNPITSITSAFPLNYKAGDVITLTGTASDAVDGDITLTNTKWYAIYNHDEHFHDGPAFATNKGKVFYTIPSHFDISNMLSYKFVLIATNSNDETASSDITIYPIFKTFIVKSTPAGINFNFFSTNVTAPKTVTGVENTPWSMSVLPEVTLSGVVYEFENATWGNSLSKYYPPSSTVTSFDVVYKEKGTTNLENNLYRLDNTITFYPNPSFKDILIKNSHISKIELFDFTGKNVETFEKNYNENYISEINIEKHSPGFYFLKFYQFNSIQYYKIKIK